MINLIDQFSRITGRVIAWLTLFMVLATSVIVIMRYAFDSGYIWMQEAVTWMHAAVFMLGAAYALEQEQHVRVDVFYREMSPRRRALVDVAGVIFLLYPLCVFFLWVSWDYVIASWQIREGSRQSGGLPYPATSLLKTMLLLMPLLVVLQGSSQLLSSIGVLRGRRPDGGARPTVRSGEL